MGTDVTQLLTAIRDGRPTAADELFPLVYNELHRQAANLLSHERPDHTLQATALVHEAYLRLVRLEKTDWQDRAHFCAVAAQAMRRILVDHARGRNRDKRGGDRDQVSLDSSLLLIEEPPGGVDLLALEEALGRLAAINPRAVKVVEMRFYGGLTIEEVKAVLGISVSTVEREWRYARAWLRRRLTRDG